MCIHICIYYISVFYWFTNFVLKLTYEIYWSGWIELLRPLPEICRPEGKKSSPSYPLSKFLTAQCRENIQCFFCHQDFACWSLMESKTQLRCRHKEIVHPHDEKSDCTPMETPANRLRWWMWRATFDESTFVFKFWNASRFIGFLPQFQVSNDILSAARNLPARWWYASIAAWLLGKFVYAYHIYIGLNNFYATSCQYM